MTSADQSDQVVGTKEADTAAETKRAGLVAAGGFVGALTASSCCIAPLVLFSLGVSGAWIGNLSCCAG